MTLIIACAAVAAPGLACRGAGAALDGGTTATAGETRQLFDALAARYTTPLRLPDYESARSRIAHNAFVPSNAWRDTSIWTAHPTPALREVHAYGTLTPAGYRIGSRAAAPPLRHLGDSRHAVTLARLEDGVYRWETLADYHIGPMALRRPAAIMSALLQTAEGRTEAQLRADYRSAFPRTAASMGRYASIDTIRPLAVRDGSTVTRLVISLHAERLARTYPALAAYLDKYGPKSRMRFVLRDRPGTPAPSTWMVVDARDNRITVDVRSRGGSLVAFSGAARTFPDTLEMVSDVVATIGPFTAGYENMRTELVRTSNSRLQTWTMTARHEPDWKLPLFAERLLRTPLRRPFEGAGSVFTIGFRDDGSATVLSRYARVTVQESAILRFFNRLGSRAFGDISPQVEAEEAAFLRLVFIAMRDDVASLAGTAP